MPLLHSIPFIDFEPEQIPNLGMSQIMEMEKSDAAIYLRNPENYHTVSGISKLKNIVLVDTRFYLFNVGFTLLHILIGLFIYHLLMRKKHT